MGSYRRGHSSSSSFKTLNRKHLQVQELTGSACGLALPHPPAAAQSTQDKTKTESLLSTSSFKFNRNPSRAIRSWSLSLFKPITNGAARELSAENSQLWMEEKSAQKINTLEATRHTLDASKAYVINGLWVEVGFTAKRMLFSSLATDLYKHRHQKLQRTQATTIKSQHESKRQLRQRARRLETIFVHLYGRWLSDSVYGFASTLQLFFTLPFKLTNFHLL